MTLESFVSGEHCGSGLPGKAGSGRGSTPVNTDFTSQLREWTSSGQDPSDYCSVSVAVVQPL